ncbi:DNA methyltransferase [Frigoribacterium sp. UYMn621]|uniref:DNA methyltransferase n=1 Tax=Frigoribacterium sp. UYMn621 TaxID=3156343 RepID=UPI0033952FF7
MVGPGGAHLPEFALIHADINDALREIPDGTFDSVIADAPYGLAITKNSGSNWDTSSIAFDPALWSQLRRVTKPGGILAAFGHPRTSHRQMTALEDAGWQVIDTIAWVKSHAYQAGNRDLEKELRKTGAEALADSYTGFRTHLSPTYEPITLARNLAPRASLVQAIATGGAGGLNIDATRLHESDWAFRTPRTTVPPTAENRARRPGRVSDRSSWSIANRDALSVPHGSGRLPGNLLLEHSEDCVETACAHGCIVAEIDSQGRTKYASGKEPASRFFTRLRYSPRARSSAGQRLAEAPHPTEKPQQLLEWLAALVVKPGSTVLDAFAGSGAVSEAALRAGAGAVTAVDREAAYVAMIRVRIEEMG